MCVSRFQSLRCEAISRPSSHEKESEKFVVFHIHIILNSIFDDLLAYIIMARYDTEVQKQVNLFNLNSSSLNS